MNSLDYLIVGLYAVGLIAIATYVSMTKKGEKKTAEDYFLAGRNLGWFVIGASLFASNIGSEHLVGLAESGFKKGLIEEFGRLMGLILAVIISISKTTELEIKLKEIIHLQDWAVNFLHDVSKIYLRLLLQL